MIKSRLSRWPNTTDFFSVRLPESLSFYVSPCRAITRIVEVIVASYRTAYSPKTINSIFIQYVDISKTASLKEWMQQYPLNCRTIRSIWLVVTDHQHHREH